MLDLVGNPEDWFTQDAAQLSFITKIFLCRKLNATVIDFCERKPPDQQNDRNVAKAQVISAPGAFKSAVLERMFLRQYVSIGIDSFRMPFNCILKGILHS